MCESNGNSLKSQVNNRMISVIVPVYNVEQYLEKCLDSIRKQTYRDLEIILVDDGTQDSSGVLCNVYAKMDDRIKVIHKKNGGLSDARNAGLDIAQGKYIAFVDGNDFIHPRMYETMVHMIETEHSDMVFCGFQQVEKDAEIDNQMEVIAKSPEFLTGRRMQNLYFQDEYSRIMVVAWNKLYRASMFEEVRFPVGKSYEDEFTTFFLTYPCRKVSCTPTPFYYYVTRQNGSMGAVNEEGFDLFESYRWRMAYYANNKEYRLLEKFTRKYMRMTNQYRKWCEEWEQDCSRQFKECRAGLLDIISQCIEAKRIRFDFSTNVEMFAYFYMNPLYYKVWKRAHR